MFKHTFTAVALATLLAAPALAQQPSTTGPGTAPMQSNAPAAGFLQSQSANDWRGSKLIGATVYGTDNQSIGEINDVIIDGTGKVTAAVVGVGGFLGVGEKDVAIPFQSLNVTRKQNSSSIDKVTVRYSKDDLKNAPKFAYYEPSGSTQTTGSSTAPRNTSTPAQK